MTSNFHPAPKEGLLKEKVFSPGQWAMFAQAEGPENQKSAEVGLGALYPSALLSLLPTETMPSTSVFPCGKVMLKNLHSFGVMHFSEDFLKTISKFWICLLCCRMVWVRRNLKNHEVTTSLPSYLVAGSAFLRRVRTFERVMFFSFWCLPVWGR